MNSRERREQIRRWLYGEPAATRPTVPPVLNDARPAPTPGDLVGYKKDPQLFGAMLMLCELVDGPMKGAWACELDPPAEIPDGYEPDVAHFWLSELGHADDIWKSAG